MELELLVSPSEERALTLQLVNRDGTFLLIARGLQQRFTRKAVYLAAPSADDAAALFVRSSKKSMLFVTRMFVNTP